MADHQDSHGASTGRRRSYNEEMCLRHNRSTLDCALAGKEHDSLECMFNQCRDWLDQCLEDHTGSHRKCHEPLAGGRFKDIFPTRLIDVGPNGSNPRLVKFDSMEQIQETSEDVRYPGYVTLSYCWGTNSDKAHLLRDENEAEFVLSLPRLPKTLQDAITICQRVGVKYIWIDAICIIQGHNDNSSDWEWQSARVGSYYANSLFTIAAAWADANDQGCLPNHTSRDRDRYLKNEDSVQFGTEWPLLQRSWVTQELSLAVRVLWMFNDCVEWSCGAGIFTNDGLTETISTFQVFRIEMGSQDWYMLLSDYSKTNLTFDEDRLPAISGICQYMDPYEKDQYIVGIWWRSILYGMTWRRTGGIHQGNNLPSWSPFSCTGHFNYLSTVIYGQRCSADEYCDVCGVGRFKVLGVDVETMYGDKYGKIRSARLLVEASLYDAHPRLSEEPACSILSLAGWETDVAGDVHWDSTWQTGRQTNAVLINHGDLDHVGEDVDEGIYLFFLLLSPVEQDVYRRVGLFISSRLDRSNPALAQTHVRANRRKIELI